MGETNLDKIAVDELEVAGTDVTSAIDEMATLNGLNATAAELNTKHLTCQISDISGANSGYVVSPYAGTLTGVYTALHGAITVGDAVLTANVAGGDDVTATTTIAYSGSAAGDVDSSTPADNNTVAVGDVIKITSDGGSTDAAAATVTFVITL